MTTLSLLSLILLILGLLYARRYRLASRSDRICRLFSLDHDQYELLGSDLAGGDDKLFLRADGLSGVPDAVFRHKKSGSIVVGEAKSRRYSGALTTYERYQVLLYLGMAKKRFKVDVHAVVRYGCGRCITLQPDSSTYADLVSLIPRFSAVAKRIDLWHRSSSRSTA